MRKGLLMSQEYYLTELILSIQNEIQSAVDYITESSNKEGSELGKSSTVMHIENLRVKLPFRVSLEHKTKAVDELSEKPVSVLELRERLAQRKGFMIDKGKAGKMANFTKVRVNGLNNQAESKSEDEVGSALAEIEIYFSPVLRD